MKRVTVKRIKHFICWWFAYWKWRIMYSALDRVLPVSVLDRVLPIKKKLICIISWNGKYFNCNPKAISEYISSYNRQNLKITAVVDDPGQYRKEFPNIRFVKTKSFAHLVAQLTCRVFIANIRMGEFHKRPGQFYLQTWHGMGPKKSEKDSCNILTEAYLKDAKRDCQQTDLMLSGSRWQTEWIRHSTWYKGEIMEKGTPRDDCFFHVKEYSHNRKKVYSTLNIKATTSLILFAPTFRSAGEIAQNAIDIDALLDAFSGRFGREFVLLLRLHPNVANQSLPKIYSKYLSDKVFNATLYPDMQELLCAADVLITDFSSVSTEFVMQNKPCFLFIPDYNSYDRGLYFKPEELPFPFSHSSQQLINSVRTFDEVDYKKRLTSYKNKIGMVENGSACKELLEYFGKYVFE